MRPAFGIAVPALLVFLALAPGCSAEAEGEGAAAGAKGADSKASPAADKTAAAAEQPEEADAAEEGGPAQAPDDEGEPDDGDDAGAPTAPEVSLDAKVGVKVCDDYVAAWKTCVESKAPDEQRPAHLSALKEQIAAWTQTVKNGGNPAAVEIGCKTALAQAKAAAEGWDCTF